MYRQRCGHQDAAWIVPAVLLVHEGWVTCDHIFLTRLENDVQTLWVVLEDDSEK